MRLSYSAQKTIRWLADLPVGGAWGRSLHEKIQKNLRWFWFDGLFAAAGDNIILNYISLYILALGGSEVQVGLMSSLSSFSGALMLFLGAIVAEKIGDHKKITIFTGGIFGRLAVLMLVFVPIFFRGLNIVWLAIAFSVMRDMCNNLAYPSWMSVVNETVPIEGRGRYFGARNFIMNISNILATLLAGKLITMFAGELGYQIAMGLAFVLGVGSIFSFAHIKTTPKIRQVKQNSRISLRGALSLLKGQPQFVALILITGLWNFAINVSGPFFNVYMAQNLHFSASMVGLMAVVTSVSGFLVFNRIGLLSDRWGPRKVQLISMWLIPLMPITWIFAKTPIQVALINAFGGVMWGAYNLTSFNLMLNSIPKDQVPRYSAIYQIVVVLSLAFGALLGSALITKYGFVTLLIISTLGRIISALLFTKFVHEPAKEPELPDQVLEQS